MLFKSVLTLTRVRGPRSAGTPASRRLDQSGGAISLWVVLMVPVAAFAAVAAMAGPQRMAAESSLEETTYDLATMAVTLRDGTDNPKGEIKGFLPDCSEDPENPGLQEVCQLLLGNDAHGGYLHRDLGYLGIDTAFWEGFYSDSVKEDACLISEDPEEENLKLETTSAVYVAVAADWESAGWAAAQVWPDGVRLGAEQVARLNRETGYSDTTTSCDRDDFLPPFTSNLSRTVFTD